MTTSCAGVGRRDRDGTPSGGQAFHAVSPGHADGLGCDMPDDVWRGAADGVHCTSPDGPRPGRSLVGDMMANLTVGGRDRSRPFPWASHHLCAIRTDVRGAERP